MKIKRELHELTDGKYYSLKEAALHLNTTPDVVYSMAKKMDLQIYLLFHKFTAYSIDQLKMIRQEIKHECERAALSKGSEVD